MNLVRSVVVFVAMAALAGCPKKEDAPPPDAQAADKPIPTESNFIHGRATYLQRIKMPPGADFTVQLIDNQLADTPQAVIAETTLEDVAGPPYEFSLQFDPAKIRPGGSYGLHATLRGAEGDLIFVTTTRVPVTPGDQSVVEFVMQMVHAAPPPAGAEDTQVHRSTWTCEGMTFDAVFDNSVPKAELWLPEGRVTLPQATSGSGARYADDAGNEFWTKGAEATLTRKGGAPVKCMQQDAKPEAGTPWDRAKERGIAFRAIGQEPGWVIEIGQGETPPMHLQLDYGERRLEVAQAQSLSGLLGFAGAAEDGTKVRLVLERKECSDTMSDERFPVDAVLEVGGTTLRGCGRFLTE